MEGTFDSGPIVKSTLAQVMEAFLAELALWLPTFPTPVWPEVWPLPEFDLVGESPWVELWKPPVLGLWVLAPQRPAQVKLPPPEVSPSQGLEKRRLSPLKERTLAPTQDQQSPLFPRSSGADRAEAQDQPTGAPLAGLTRPRLFQAQAEAALPPNPALQRFGAEMAEVTSPQRTAIPAPLAVPVLGPFPASLEPQGDLARSPLALPFGATWPQETRTQVYQPDPSGSSVLPPNIGTQPALGPAEFWRNAAPAPGTGKTLNPRTGQTAQKAGSRTPANPKPWTFLPAKPSVGLVRRTQEPKLVQEIHQHQHKVFNQQTYNYKLEGGITPHTAAQAG